MTIVDPPPLRLEEHTPRLLLLRRAGEPSMVEHLDLRESAEEKEKRRERRMNVREGTEARQAARGRSGSVTIARHTGPIIGGALAHGRAPVAELAYAAV